MSEMILLRATRLNPTSTANAAALRAASGLALAYVLDERGGPVPGAPADRVGITRAGCEALGLFCPPDFAWRCGDYGLYLARRRFPDVERFWLFDYDVRIGGRDPAAFFARCRAAPHDFLGAVFRLAEDGWHWRAHGRNRHTPPWRCFFPVLRASARAADALLAKRVAHGRRPNRRILWPNDESFVATTLRASGLSCADFNDLGEPSYDTATFSYETVLDGDALPPCDADARLLHPVLFGEELDRKRAALTRDTVEHAKLRRRFDRVVARANAYAAW